MKREAGDQFDMLNSNTRIEIVRPSANFTMVPNEAIRERSLSFRAVGLFAYLMSLPPGAGVTLSGLAKVKTEGKDAVTAAKAELEAAGLLRVIEERTQGRYSGFVWMLALRPHDFGELLPGGDGEMTAGEAKPEAPKAGKRKAAESPKPEGPKPVSPEPGKPLPANPPHYKIDHSKNDLSKTETTPTPLEGLIEDWNAFALKHDGVEPVSRIAPTGKRGREALARLADPHWRAHYREALEQIPKKRWRLGFNDRGWHANFGWFVRPDTVDTLIEESKATGQGAAGLRESDLPEAFAFAGN